MTTTITEIKSPGDDEITIPDIEITKTKPKNSFLLNNKTFNETTKVRKDNKRKRTGKQIIQILIIKVVSIDSDDSDSDFVEIDTPISKQNLLTESQKEKKREQKRRRISEISPSLQPSIRSTLSDDEKTPEQEKLLNYMIGSKKTTNDDSFIQKPHDLSKTCIPETPATEKKETPQSVEKLFSTISTGCTPKGTDRTSPSLSFTNEYTNSKDTPAKSSPPLQDISRQLFTDDDESSEKKGFKLLSPSAGSVDDVMNEIQKDIMKANMEKNALSSPALLQIDKITTPDPQTEIKKPTSILKKGKTPHSDKRVHFAQNESVNVN